MKRILVHVVVLVALGIGLASAGPNDPIVGEEFEALVAAQQVALQAELELLIPDSLGVVVTGPMSSVSRNYYGRENLNYNYESIRLICPGPSSCGMIVRLLGSSTDSTYDSSIRLLEPVPFTETKHLVWTVARAHNAAGPNQYAIARGTSGNRFWIWHYQVFWPWVDHERKGKSICAYLPALRSYLDSVHTGWMDAHAPKAIDYGLPDSLDFYAPPPDYVIEGYDNYLNFLNAHDTIRADFAYGLTEFTPSDSLWDAMIENAPRAAWPNKEWPMLQHEYKKFFERGGDVRVMQRLTREGFDTLQAGEYFFAVSVAGKVRFGRELLREEVKRIEAETGKKVPRANHAFLFPGEPVLTAGAFFIEDSKDTEEGHYLSHINAQSGHFFYSNVSETIREDIAVRSDEYLLTLGHFFRVLDSLNIPHDNVVVSKL